MIYQLIAKIFYIIIKKENNCEPIIYTFNLTLLA